MCVSYSALPLSLPPYFDTLTVRLADLTTNPSRSLVQTILFLIFSGFETYVSVLGFVALGLESTLPIPQLITSVHAHSPLWMSFLC